MQAANSAVILVLSWTVSGWRPSRPRRGAGAGALLVFGGHVTGYNLVTYVCNNLDAVLVGRLAGSVALGFYDRALRLVATPFWQISLPVPRVAVPLLSRLQGRDAEYRDAFATMIQALLLALAPLLVCIAGTAGTAVPLLLGARWRESAPMVSWLAVATLLSPLGLASYWLFVSQGRAREQVPYALAKTAITLVAVLLGLRSGALGVTRMLAVLSLPINGVALWGALRAGPVRPRHLLRSLLPAAAGLAAAGVILPLLRNHAPAPAHHAAVGLSLDLLAAYLAFSGAFFLVPSQLRTRLCSAARKRSLVHPSNCPITRAV